MMGKLQCGCGAGVVERSDPRGMRREIGWGWGVYVVFWGQASHAAVAVDKCNPNSIANPKVIVEHQHQSPAYSIGALYQVLGTADVNTGQNSITSSPLMGIGTQNRLVPALFATCAVRIKSLGQQSGALSSEWTYNNQ